MAREPFVTAPVLAEGLVDLRVEPLGDDAGALGELAATPRGLLELGSHEVGVRAGLLAVEHPRADLDRVERQLPRVLVLARKAHGAFVVDDEAVDGQRARRATRTVAKGRGVAASIATEGTPAPGRNGRTGARAMM